MTRHVRQRASDQLFLAEHRQCSGLRDVSVRRTEFGLEVQRADRRLTVPVRPEPMSQDEWADDALAVLVDELSQSEVQGGPPVRASRSRSSGPAGRAGRAARRTARRSPRS